MRDQIEIVKHQLLLEHGDDQLMVADIEAWAEEALRLIEG